MRVLVVNAGSSSVKLRLLGDADDLLGSVDLDAPGGAADAAQLEAALHKLGEADAVGHRVVHGGSRFTSAVRVDERVVEGLRALTELAPLHQPKSLAALAAVGAALPGVPAVACFDTSFHATLSAPAATYALPRELNERYELRRYGFHGLSHAYVSRRAAELLGRPPAGLRIVTCHLGAGASLAAVQDGRSVDTTMGFTPLDGLVMATRSGSVDPGLLVWLLERGELSIDEVGDALEHRSGLFGLAGTADMREVLARAERGSAAAQLALEVYLHRLRGGIGAMAAAMDGLDALAFSGGVGENAPAVREAAVAGLGFLGAQVDVALNSEAKDDADVSAPGARARTLVVNAREDLEIARQVRELLTDSAGTAGTRR